MGVLGPALHLQPVQHGGPNALIGAYFLSKALNLERVQTTGNGGQLANESWIEITSNK